MTSRAISPTSHSCKDRAAEPASKREISSRSASILSKRSICPNSSSVLRFRRGSLKLSRASNRVSPASKMVVIGVRSSWETSETKRCCRRESSLRRSIWASIESAMLLKDSAREAASSWLLISRRSPKLPAARRWAASEVRLTGSSTRQVSNATAIPMATTSMAPPDTRARVATSSRCCSFFSEYTRNPL